MAQDGLNVVHRMVWRFDRFARSTKHLITALETFKNLKIDFVSYPENTNTSSPLGEAIFTIVAAVGKLERDIIAERMKAGLRRAKENEKQLVRPRLRVDPEAIHRMRNQGLSYRAIASRLGVSHPTVMATLKSS